MAISFGQTVIIKGPQEQLVKLSPLVSDGPCLYQLHMSAGMNYCLPFNITKISKEYPELLFLDNRFCDTDFIHTIHLTQNNKSIKLFDEQYWVGTDEFSKAWREYSSTLYDKLVKLFSNPPTLQPDSWFLEQIDDDSYLEQIKLK